MTNLTEQLVKGTLKEYTYYYVLRNNGKTDIKMWTNKKYSSAVDWFNTYDVKGVLAEVPSYEEWQRIFHYASKYEHEYTSCAMDYENLKEENNRLKGNIHSMLFTDDVVQNRYDKAKEENAQLKELLKECSYRIDWRTRTGHKPSDEETQKLFDEISQVLGEE